MALMIVGFSGRPVAAGAGLKPVLLHNTKTDRYAVAQEDSSPSWWKESEVLSHEVQALLTRVAISTPHIDGHVALYAHSDFIAPPQQFPGWFDAPELIHLSAADLLLDLRSSSYFCFTSREKALEVLDQWAELLLMAAEHTLLTPYLALPLRGSVAFKESMRARFALAGRQDARARTRSKRALVLSWASLAIQFASTDSLKLDASMDFSDEEIEEARLEALNLLSRILQTYNPKEWPPRQLKDSIGSVPRVREEQLCSI